MKLLLIAISTVLLGSCAFHSGQFVADIPDTAVEHIDIATGVATTTKIFGLGSVGKDALIREARQEMINNRPLVDAESYNNYTIDIKRTNFIIGWKTKVTMSADVIIPKDTLSKPTFSGEYLAKMDDAYSHYDSLFHIGDSVIFNKDRYAKIVGFDGKDNKRARIEYRNKQGDLITRTRHCTKIYVLIRYYRGNRGRITRPLGNSVAYGVNGDIFKNKDGTYYHYGHNE